MSVGRKPIQFTDKDMETIVAMYVSGYSYRTIYEKLGTPCSMGAMINWIKMAGLEREGKGKRVFTCAACGRLGEGKARIKYCAVCIPSKGWIQRYSLYGMTKPIYDQTFKEQDGLCAMCSNPLPDDPLRVHVDHCHKQGDVRGLLCGRCNNALGYIEDEELVLNAKRYLATHREK